MKLFDSYASLEDFIGRYQPLQWCEPIRSCCHVPLFTDEHYEQLKQGNYDCYYRKLEWYEKNAIKEFFKQLKEQEI